MCTHISDTLEEVIVYFEEFKGSSDSDILNSCEEYTEDFFPFSLSDSRD